MKRKNGKESVMSDKKFNLYKTCFIINIILLTLLTIFAHLQEKPKEGLEARLFDYVVMIIIVLSCIGNKERLTWMYKFYFVTLLILLAIATFTAWIAGMELLLVIVLATLYGVEITMAIYYTKRDKEKKTR